MQPAPEHIRLTQYSKGAGCGCKLAPGVLGEILKTLPYTPQPPALLVGNETQDDAAVYDLGDTMGGGMALVSTVDFFSPIVDDAFDYGAIAAANALSDVYAMGGRPVLALAVLGWPIEKLPARLAGTVMTGASETCIRAGVPLAGGHSIESPEPFFGLVVTGLVPTAHMKRNRGAQPGDVLLLTKPLGTGLVTTALKRGFADAAHVEAAVASMQQLNAVGTQLGSLPAVHAMTDVTGFGLAGHLTEMLADTLDAEIHFSALPLLPGVPDYLARDAYSDGTMRNFKAYAEKLTIHTKEHLYLLCDPQTNGGLLIACAPTAVPALTLNNAVAFSQIGTVKAGTGKVVVT